jgi:hypothetical protein
MRMRTLWRGILPLYILALTVGWNATHRHPQLRVTLLDVGQGDSCVVEVTVSGTVHVRCWTLNQLDDLQEFCGYLNNSQR